MNNNLRRSPRRYELDWLRVWKKACEVEAASRGRRWKSWQGTTIIWRNWRRGTRKTRSNYKKTCVTSTAGGMRLSSSKR
jgi:hypothetical protein